MMDSQLSGQRTAAIHTEEAGMTLVRVQISHVPVAVEVSPGMPEALYGLDLLLRDVSRAAVVLGDVRNQHNEVTLENVQCANVARLLEHGEAAAGWTPIPAPAPFFTEEALTVGQEIDEHGREAQIALRHREHVLHAQPAPVPSDIPTLPPRHSPDRLQPRDHAVDPVGRGPHLHGRRRGRASGHHAERRRKHPQRYRR